LDEPIKYVVPKMSQLVYLNLLFNKFYTKTLNIFGLQMNFMLIEYFG
jgi:hypothetical protein